MPVGDFLVLTRGCVEHSTVGLEPVAEIRDFLVQVVIFSAQLLVRRLSIRQGLLLGLKPVYSSLAFFQPARERGDLFRQFAVSCHQRRLRFEVLGRGGATQGAVRSISSECFALPSFASKLSLRGEQQRS